MEDRGLIVVVALLFLVGYCLVANTLLFKLWFVVDYNNDDLLSISCTGYSYSIYYNLEYEQDYVEFVSLGLVCGQDCVS